MKRILALLITLTIIFSTTNTYASRNKSDESVGFKNSSANAGEIIVENKRLEASSIFFKYLYKSIDDAAVDAREQIYNHMSTIDIYCKSASSNADTVYDQVLEKIFAPTGNSSQGDYMKWDINHMSVSYTRNTSGGTYYYHFIANTDYLTTIAQRDLVNLMVSEAIRSFNFASTTTDYTKIKTVYDYICDNVTYSEDTTEDIVYTSYSAIVNGNAVCQGYSQLMYKFMVELGISCRIIPGYGTQDTTENHGWNIVKLGNYYYNVDSTWDAVYRQYKMNYRYFLRGDNFENHSRWKDYATSEFYSAYPMAANDYGVGTATASTASIKATFVTIKPKIKSCSRKKIKFQKVAGAQGYQIKYSTISKYTKSKTKTVKTKKTTYKFKKLKAKKKYYVKFRAYRKVAGATIYTKYSSTKKIKKK